MPINTQLKEQAKLEACEAYAQSLYKGMSRIKRETAYVLIKREWSDHDEVTGAKTLTQWVAELGSAKLSHYKMVPSNQRMEPRLPRCRPVASRGRAAGVSCSTWHG